MAIGSSPLIIIEGLVNGYNDLISVSLVIIGLYYLFKKKKVLSTLFIVLSIGIKYLTFPFLLVLAKFKNNKLLILSSVLGVIIFLTIKSEIQPWYFIILFGLLPFYENLIFHFNIFFFGLLMSYYPYVRFGGWGKVLYWTTDQKVVLKHEIIFVFFCCKHRFYFFKKIIPKEDILIL